MQNEHFFETLSPTRLFFRCALPSMVSMSVVSLYTVADGIFVGRCIGADALAAVNLVMPLIMISFALADLIAVGSAVQIAIRLGEKKQDDANRIFSFCAGLIFLISCAAGVLGWFFAEPAVKLMGADATVTAYAVDYLRMYAVFSPGIMIFFALDNYLRICGRVKYSMLLNVGTALVNIALDFLFLVVWHQGVAAAALASCLSLMLGTVLSLAPFLTRRLSLRFTRGTLSPRLLGNIIANGSSEFFSNIASSAMMVLLNTVLLHLAGATAVAAFSIVMYVDSIVGSLLYGMADALQPAISYHYGAGLQQRMIALEKRVLTASALVSLAAMTAMLLGGGWIIPLFVPAGDNTLLQMSLRAMQLFSLSYLTVWAGTAFSSFFTALSRPVPSLVLSLSRTLLFPLLGVAVLPALWGLDGVWLMPALGAFATALLALCLLRPVMQRTRLEPIAPSEKVDP